MPPSKAPPPDGPWQPIQANLDLADDPILPQIITSDMPRAVPHEIARSVAANIKPVLLQAQRQTLAGIPSSISAAWSPPARATTKAARSMP